jgi:hypothetical protein
MSKILNFIRPRWKAIMPLVAMLLTLVADRVADLDLSAEVKTLIGGVLAAILVYLKSNTAPVLPAPAPPAGGDAGLAFIEVVIIIMALAVVVIAIKVF